MVDGSQHRVRQDGLPGRVQEQPVVVAVRPAAQEVVPLPGVRLPVSQVLPAGAVYP